MATTVDYILNHRVYLRQPQKGYRAGLDAVFLAASIPATSGDHILDLGTGVGAASLAVLARIPGVFASGIERVDPIVALARENALLNKVADHFTVYKDNLASPTGAWKDRLYDHVLANPPYYPAHAFTHAAPGYKRAAHIETPDAPLEKWVSCAAALVKPGGTVTFIFPGPQEARLYALFAPVFRDIKILPLWSTETSTEPLRVILQGRKDVALPLRCHRYAPFILHDTTRAYTPAAEDILRRALPTVLGTTLVPSPL